MMKAVGDQCILYVMATDMEYGAALKERIVPHIIQVGPVEAAMHMTDLLSLRMLPDLVVSLGSAGSRTLKQGEVYQVSHVSYRDMDASPLGFAKGRTPYLDLPAEMALRFEIAGLPSARLSTGGGVISDAAYDGIDADMVDMETFAVMRVCQRFNVPLIGLRGISDGREELRRYEDWTDALAVVDAGLGHAVDKVETAVADGLLS